MKQHPRNHNPRPAISATALRNKAMCDPEPISFVERMVAQHRDKWLPAWQSGRMVPDLHNWITDYDPDADIGPVNGKARHVDPCTCTWEAADAECPVHREQLRRMS